MNAASSTEAPAPACLSHPLGRPPARSAALWPAKRHLLAENRDRADQLAVLEHRDHDQGPRASKFDESDENPPTLTSAYPASLEPFRPRTRVHAGRLVDLGGIVLAGSSADFKKHIADETAKWAKVIKVAGTKPE